MIRKIIVTEDDSKSIFLPELEETYHSVHGAKSESEHIFIQCGLIPQLNEFDEIRILEMGFGTGLNALLTLASGAEISNCIYYDAYEKYPIDPDLIDELNHPETTQNKHLESAFKTMHSVKSGQPVQITEKFTFTKILADFCTVELASSSYNLIYFDAFAPKIQPELWQLNIMEKLYNSLTTNGILVSYCAQGQFRRNLKAAGFLTERIPGPKGKREITRAIKV